METLGEGDWGPSGSGKTHGVKGGGEEGGKRDGEDRTPTRAGKKTLCEQ